ncbi:DUF429 domain-containing protein [Arthrobacter sp. D1-17]
MMTVAVGIDVGLLDGKGLDPVALDASRRIRQAVPHLRDLDELVRVVETHAPEVVCIDSPSQWAEPGTRCPAELDLARRGINLYATPPADRASPFHRWMQDGFSVYAALAHAYPRYTGGDVHGKAAEYFPHASAVALNGRIGALAEKIPIRRQLLAEQGIDERVLIGADQVDAALGALTGLIALEGRHSWVGEGTDAMLLPVQELRARYLRAPAAPAVRSVGGTAHPPFPADEKRAPCLCGCGGTPAGRRSRFKPGHHR